MLKGTDPVLSLMDKRVRDVFKAACTFEMRRNSNSAMPQSMHSGIQSKAAISPGTVQKNAFIREVSDKAAKVGFGVVVEDLVEVAYDAFKMIDHCVKVHEEEVLIPIINELRSQTE